MVTVWDKVQGHQLAESQVFASGDPKQSGKGLWSTVVFSYKLCGEVRLPFSAANPNYKQDKRKGDGAGRAVFQEPDGGVFHACPEPHDVTLHHMDISGLILRP